MKEATYWAREEDSEKALDQYLLLGARVFNRTAVTMLDSLGGNISGKTVVDYGGGAGLMAIPYANA